MINELTKTRGKYIFDIELDNGDEYRVAGNCIEDALSDIRIDFVAEHNRTFTFDDGYIINAKVRTEDFENFNEFDYDV